LDSDFVASIGRPLLAHRLRRLSELFVDGYSQWLPSLGVTAPARSLSTLLLLEREGPLGVTEIAARLRLSHPLMIKLVAGLEAEGLVAPQKDPDDARRRPIALTSAGRSQVKQVQHALLVLDRAYADLGKEVGADLLTLIERVESASLEEPFGDRLRRATEEIEKGRNVDA
jgi:DNA-binding MarR family transcriptional regulator